MTERLNRQLERWQAAEIISAEQRTEIQAFEQAHRDSEPRETESFVLFRGWFLP